MLQAGVPIKVVSERLGHASAQLTMDIYAHCARDGQRRRRGFHRPRAAKTVTADLGVIPDGGEQERSGQVRLRPLGVAGVRRLAAG